ncbi:MAG TPA: T9SS type A sorting domain-containing protein [Cytophagaceae bacterium]|jgi:hypothetical protein|nr:T9SS type A sorting domain-containing protein [Cytophagaceae bacterium]
MKNIFKLFAPLLYTGVIFSASAQGLDVSIYYNSNAYGNNQMPGTIYEGTTIYLTALITGANPGNSMTYTWDFGDGSSTPAINATAPNNSYPIYKTYSYAACGNYTITLTINDNSVSGGSGLVESSNEFYVQVAPNRLRDIALSSVCWSSHTGNVQLSAQLDNSNVSYNWTVTSPTSLPADFLLNPTSANPLLNFSKYPILQFPYNITINLQVSGGCPNNPQNQLSKTFTINSVDSDGCRLPICNRNPADYVPGTCNELMSGTSNFYVESYVASTANNQISLSGINNNGYIKSGSVYWQSPSYFTNNVVYSLEFDASVNTGAYSSSELVLFLANGLKPGKGDGTDPLPASGTYNTYELGYTFPQCIGYSFQHFKINFVASDMVYNQLWIEARALDGVSSRDDFTLKNFSLKTAEYAFIEQNICYFPYAANNFPPEIDVTGKTINLGQPNCSGNLIINTYSHIILEASDEININPNVDIRSPDFEANITTPCGNIRMRQSAEMTSPVPGLFNDETEQDKQYLVYPNPSNGHFQLHMPSSVHHIMIYDLVGTRLLDADITETLEVDLSTHPNGMYILKTDDGNDLKVHKIIVSK